MEILTSKNEIITDIQMWKNTFFTGKKAKHWKKGRSAMATAEYWLNSENIKALEDKLKSIVPDIKITKVYPECRLKFDNFGNGHENDILAIDQTTKTIISVESKTDEPFGNDTFLIALKNAIREKHKNENSNAVERCLGLYTNYFHGNNNILSIQYQLTYWFAGSIAKAKTCSYGNVILLNQVFNHTKLDKKKLDKNHRDFQNLIKLISESKINNIDSNKLYGPICNKYTQGVNVFALKESISKR